MTTPKPKPQNTERKNPNDRLTGQELSGLIAYLRDEKGLRGQDLATIIVANMTRRQAAAALARYLQTLPKAQV